MGTKFKGIKKEKRALNAFINLKRAVKSLDSRLSKHFTQHGLTESQFGVLEALFHLGTLNQKQLSEKLLVTGGNMTLVIDNLEKRKFVERIRDENDRRFFNIKLTRKGGNLIEKIFPSHVEAIVAEFEVLTKKEQDSIRDLCRRLGRGK